MDPGWVEIFVLMYHKRLALKSVIQYSEHNEI